MYLRAPVGWGVFGRHHRDLLQPMCPRSQRTAFSGLLFHPLDVCLFILVFRENILSFIIYLFNSVVVNYTNRPRGGVTVFVGQNESRPGNTGRPHSAQGGPRRAAVPSVGITDVLPLVFLDVSLSRDPSPAMLPGLGLYKEGALPACV